MFVHTSAAFSITLWISFKAGIQSWNGESSSSSSGEVEKALRKSPNSSSIELALCSAKMGLTTTSEDF
ncbi:hypothetical protein TCAL_15153 [Tigriopus californicus]|uniref:Secreted protein n=1 Tax=Tigriopus californicus TaxID=6832 RepID=A0A553NVU8_TIGCA|nr:hypothetical protein TCAL_15153 [Tigriopus californicus]